jgi:hypothetical protein
MISKPIFSDPSSTDAVPGVAVPASQSAATAEPHIVDLTSAEAWVELIHDIVSMADNGGGRLVVRCLASGESDSSAGRVFSAPINSVAKLKTIDSKPGAQNAAPANLRPVRIVTDPDAPALQPQDVDRLYPWRQKDLLRELNTRLGRRTLNSYDIQAVRRQHQLDEHPDFVFNLPGAGRRYSPAAAEWMMEQHARDPEFFHQARLADHEIMKLRRHKPK